MSPLLSRALVGITALVCGCATAAPPPRATTSAPSASKVACPAWESVELWDQPERAAPDAPWPQVVEQLRQAMDEGRLLQAAALANGAALRCAQDPAEAKDSSELQQLFASLRELMAATQSGDHYVSAARAAKAQPARARAAWDLAWLAYTREFHSTPRATKSVAVSAGWVHSQRACRQNVRTVSGLAQRIRRLDGTELYLWELRRSEQDSPVFEGIVRDLELLTPDAWLVQHADSRVELWTSDGATKPLPIGLCLSEVHVVGSWLIAMGNDQAAHFVDLARPDDTFNWPVPGGEMSVSTAGPYVLLRTRMDDDIVPLAVFRLDKPAGQREVWKRTSQEGGELQVLPKWGAVLGLRASRVNPASSLGFEWELQAIQLETGKRLAHLELEPDAVSRPVLALSERYGLVAIGRGGEVWVVPLGGGPGRKVPSNHVEGQVDVLAVTDDGLVCANAVVHGRYYSCGLDVVADLRGAGRQSGHPNLECLYHGDRTWSGNVRPGSGRQRVVSGGRTVMFSVCGERLSPDGRTAAFLEVRERKTSEDGYDGAVVRLFDTRRAKRLFEIPVHGHVEPMYPFIDFAYSPDGRHVAVLFDRHVEVFNVQEGRRVGPAPDATDWLRVEWVDGNTMTGGAEHKLVYSLRGDELVVEPATVDGPSVCLVGDRLVPDEVCASVSR